MKMLIARDAAGAKMFLILMGIGATLPANLLENIWRQNRPTCRRLLCRDAGPMTELDFWSRCLDISYAMMPGQNPWLKVSVFSYKGQVQSQ